MRRTRERGKRFISVGGNPYSQKSVGLETGFGGSAFGICRTKFDS